MAESDLLYQGDGQVQGDELVRKVARKLKDNHTVTKIDLSRNSVGNEGARDLAQLLLVNKRILSLKLAHNNIGDDGATALAQALVTNSALTKIDLRGNTIRKVGAESFAKMLQVNTTILKVDLGGNYVSNDGAVNFSKVLKASNHTLRSLSLSDNHVDDVGASALASALERNTGLVSLHLASNQIGSEGLSHLCHSLRANATMTKVDISGNRGLCRQVHQALLSGLQSNRTMSVVIMDRLPEISERDKENAPMLEGKDGGGRDSASIVSEIEGILKANSKRGSNQYGAAARRSSSSRGSRPFSTSGSTGNSAGTSQSTSAGHREDAAPLAPAQASIQSSSAAMRSRSDNGVHRRRSSDTPMRPSTPTSRGHADRGGGSIGGASARSSGPGAPSGGAHRRSKSTGSFAPRGQPQPRYESVPRRSSVVSVSRPSRHGRGTPLKEEPSYADQGHQKSSSGFSPMSPNTPNMKRAGNGLFSPVMTPSSLLNRLGNTPDRPGPSPRIPALPSFAGAAPSNPAAGSHGAPTTSHVLTSPSHTSSQGSYGTGSTSDVSITVLFASTSRLTTADRITAVFADAPGNQLASADAAQTESFSPQPGTIIVDPSRDMALKSWLNMAACTLKTAPSAPMKAQMLALLVSNYMGGVVCPQDNMESSVETAIGSVKCGTSRHRAVLFKYLADNLDLPSTLERSPSDNRGGANSYWNSVPFGPGQDGLVDLCSNIGQVYPYGSSSAFAYISSGGTSVPSCEMEQPSSGKVSKSSMGKRVLCNLPDSSMDIVRKSKIGGGSFATVYRCNMGAMSFALKSVQISKGIDRALQEVVIIEKLAHDNIVKYLGHELVSSTRLDIFMEYLPCSLNTYLKKVKAQSSKGISPRLPEDTIWFIAQEVVKGLHYLHDQAPQQIIHRDLKSKNILLDYNAEGQIGFVKLCDFGVSKVIDECHQGETLVGTWYWMAPEILANAPERGKVPYTVKADIWSYAMVLLELHSLSVPYVEYGEQLNAIKKNILNGVPPNIPANTSPVMHDVMLSCLQ
eukprot:gene10042-266_t